ncbi:MAG: threonine synthase [Candidatus Marinimicrobia bacterium]|nr:threonine synthase [Candidatus Neomarinimicrobiota bacterium]
MEYISTRNKKQSYSFKEIFLRGLAPDGGLFIPKEIKRLDESKIEKLSQLSYIDLATEIISYFCSPELEKDKLHDLIKKSYKNFLTNDIVKIKKVGDINLIELYHGPTLAFKDIAMQVLGNMYDEFNITSKKKINIIVATSGDTGSAAISAFNDRKNINVFVLHPHNKISNIQRKIMTTIGSNNIYNIALKGSFDDCQNLVKEMFSDNSFREKINMSGVNSINWARIVCQVVYYFFSYFKFQNKKVTYAVPTGNFGDVFAGYVAKKMGLPIEKLVVATNENDILERVINTGLYKPAKVKPSLSPSMDVQISSNFERLLFDVLNEDDKQVSTFMSDLKSKGSFLLNKEQVSIIKKNFSAKKISDKETIEIIKNFSKEHNFVLDPHTATAVGASKLIKDTSEILVLGTAHPYKFLETIKVATSQEVDAPKQIAHLMDKKEKYDILEKKVDKIKNYIIDKIT